MLIYIRVAKLLNKSEEPFSFSLYNINELLCTITYGLKISGNITCLTCETKIQISIKK